MAKKTEQVTRKEKSDKVLYRAFVLNREAVDIDARTVELTFSSETRDVERWFGTEILDHSPGSADFSRMQAAGPLLFNHDWDRHIGVVDDIKIENRKGKALVRFGRSAYAEEKFQDVQDGILVNVSFGYRVFELVLEERNDEGPDVYRAMKWEPYEITLLTVAADISVGVGRAADNNRNYEIVFKEEREMDDIEEETEVIKPAAPAATRGGKDDIDVREVETNTRKEMSAMLRMGERAAKFGGVALARKFIEDGKSAEELRHAIIERLPEETRAGSGEQAGDLDMEKPQIEGYSVMSAIRAIVATKEGAATKRIMADAAFELECSRDIAERAGRDPRGIYIPTEVLARSARSMMMSRVMNSSDMADLINTTSAGEAMIMALRPSSIALQLGVRVLDGLVGNVEIPRELLTPTFYWVDEDEEPQESEFSTGSLKLTPKTIAGAMPMTRRLMKQASISVESFSQNSLLAGLALGLDKAVFVGQGTDGEPLGICNHTGLNVQTVATPGVPTWAETVGFETKVAEDNALTGSMAYFTTPTVRGTLKTTKKDAGSGIFLSEGKELNGHPLSATSQLQANTIGFGNFSDVIVGMWGVVDINPDVSTKAGTGGMVLRVFQDADVGLGHAESFCING